MGLKIQILFFIGLIFIITSCKTVSIEQPIDYSETDAVSDTIQLIRDCPETKVINKQLSNDKNTSREWYIYKGKSMPASAFDLDWINFHCNMEIEILH